MTDSADPISFVAKVRPLLAARDSGGLVQVLNADWSIDRLIAFLAAPQSDARKVAVVCLSLVGDLSAVDPVSRLLASPDPLVNQLAEHTLWTIWFRAGTDNANHELCRGAKALARREFGQAVEHFDAAIAEVPDFAEAFNQRAIAHYLADRYDQSIADCRRAVELIPCHFGAWAGMGHCFLHQEKFADALRCYDRAMVINPHLDSLRQAADQIRTKIGRTGAEF
jgi:tetratricopeptide (TPR) repeat protein